MAKIKLSLIDTDQANRKHAASQLELLKSSIQRQGLFHRLTVVRVGRRYRLVMGHGRFAAVKELGWDTVECDILPPETSEAEQAEMSLAENDVRQDAAFEQKTARIEQIMRERGCTETEASERAGVRTAYGNKALRIRKEMGPEARALYQEKKDEIGISVLYAIVSKVRDHAQQLELLTDYVEGRKTRDDLVRELAKPRAKRAKPLRIGMSLEDASVMVTVPASADYATIERLLELVRSRIRAHQQAEIPLDQLPAALQTVSAAGN